jgi:hypothetical protein
VRGRGHHGPPKEALFSLFQKLLFLLTGRDGTFACPVRFAEKYCSLICGKKKKHYTMVDKYAFCFEDEMK